MLSLLMYHNYFEWNSMRLDLLTRSCSSASLAIPCKVCLCLIHYSFHCAIHNDYTWYTTYKKHLHLNIRISTFSICDWIWETVHSLCIQIFKFGDLMLLNYSSYGCILLSLATADWNKFSFTEFHKVYNHYKV